jgi:hypothetical protein
LSTKNLFIRLVVNKFGLFQRLLRLDAPQLVDLEGKVSLAVLLAVLAEILQRASWVLGKFRHSESMLRAETVLLVRPLACKYANSISNPEGEMNTGSF